METNDLKTFSKYLIKFKDKSKLIWRIQKMWTIGLNRFVQKGISQEAQDVFFVGHKNKLVFTPDGWKKNKNEEDLYSNLGCSILRRNYSKKRAEELE